MMLATRESMKILIVDDNPQDIKSPYLLSHHLGYQVDLAFDGEQALSSVVREDFNLIILDWHLPIVSGLVFMEKLRKARVKGVNIVVHSGTTLSHADFPMSDNFRVLDIWKKPIGPAEMSRRMNRLRNRILGE